MGIAITPKIQYTRDENGRAIMKAQNADNVLFKGVGYISGNGTLSFGSTDSVYNKTQITYSAEKDVENELILDNKNGQNVNITGENANVSCLGGNAQRTIQVDASASNIDLSSAGGVQTVQVTKNTQDNRVSLGSAGDIYTDEGKFNYAEDNGGANKFTTTNTSHGSVIVAGAGNDTFVICGKFGVFDGGNGNNVYGTTMAEVNDTTIKNTTIDGSFRNVVIGGNGNETFIDKGMSNIFFGNGGADAVEFHGIKGIADLTNNSGEAGGKFMSSATESFAFASTKTIWVTDRNGNKVEKEVTFDVYQKIIQYGWTLEDFFEYSEISIENPDGVADHKALSGAILAKLNQLLNNENLQK